MHKYFAQHGNPDYVWAPPPGLADPSWSLAFERGSTQAKHNIANEWLWLLNKELAKVDDHVLLFAVAPYAAMYSKVSTFVSTGLFDGHRLKGVLADFTVDTMAQWASVKESGVFIDMLNKCWFSDGLNPLRFHDIINFCSQQDVYGLEVVKRYFPIFESLVANNVAYANSGQEQWYELSVIFAAKSGLAALDPDGLTNHSKEHSAAYAWKKLCYMVRYGKKLTKEQKRNDYLTPIIAATEPLVAVKAFDLILKSHALAKRSSPPILPARTILNEDTEDTTNVYPMLRKWIPALTDVWSAAESLDLPYESVFSNILNAPREKIDLELPEDIRLFI